MDKLEATFVLGIGDWQKKKKPVFHGTSYHKSIFPDEWSFVSTAKTLDI